MCCSIAAAGRRPCSNRSISPAHCVHSSKLTAAACDGQTPNSFTDPMQVHTNTHTRLEDLCPGLPGAASTRKVKPIWILLKQETVSGSGISWAICKSAPRSIQITTPAPHCSVFYRLDALPAAQPTASKHGRETQYYDAVGIIFMLADPDLISTEEDGVCSWLSVVGDLNSCPLDCACQLSWHCITVSR